MGDRATVVAGVGTNATAHSVELAQQAEKIGADGLLLVTPYYNKPGQAGVLHHFRDGRRGQRRAGDALRRPRPHRHHDLAGDLRGRRCSSSTVVAVKDAVGDFARGVRLDRAGLRRLLRRRRRQPRLAGPRRSGFVSVVGHVAGDQLRAMVDAFYAGDHARPSQIYTRLLPAIDAVMGVANYGATTAKAALQLLGVLDNRNVRAPLVPLDDDEVAALRAGLTAAGLLLTANQDHYMSHPHPELSAPAELPKGGLRVIPLGGLGEVGRNMTVFEYDGRLLIVDCGVLFPEDHHPGVDLILPDFEPIRDRLDDIEALVLTHGHEDHIGATPYLLRERGDIPLVGSELTLALLGSKLREHRLQETVHHVVKEGDRISFGPFDLEFVAVNHSIPDALAVAIRTGAGMVLHTGDFKMDQLPLDGRITDLRAFARLGEEGVDLFLTDSTNAEVPGLHHLRAQHRPGARPGLPPEQPADHRGLLRLPRAPRPAGARRRRRAQAARSRTSAARWSATWRSPRTSATSTSRRTCWSTPRSWPTCRPRGRC